MILEARGLSRRFGGVLAVDQVSVSVSEAELAAVIGPNGAGKSTLFHLISGHLRPDAGSVFLRGTDVSGLPPDRRAKLGMAIAFQSVRLFREMSVLENVMVGGHAWTSYGFVGAFLQLPSQRREEAAIRDQALTALQMVGLEAQAELLAESLPLGLQRAVQVARALCARPSVLLLDEPASGLRGAERERLSPHADAARCAHARRRAVDRSSGDRRGQRIFVRPRGLARVRAPARANPGSGRTASRRYVPHRK